MNKKILIVHDWLDKKRGAENALEAIFEIYPDADLFTLVDFSDKEKLPFLKETKITTSFIQRLPFAKKHFRKYLPLFPIAIEQFDPSGYDLVISSSFCVAKGIIPKPHQTHICYMHSPIRYAWDLQSSYLKDSGLKGGIKGIIAKYTLHKLRIWDVISTARTDYFVANSNFIKNRIQKCYNCSAQVIFPPVETDMYKPQTKVKKQDYYFTICRHVCYKKLDIIVKAFNEMPDKKLYIAGSGPETKKLEKLITSKNIVILGRIKNIDKIRYFQEAKAFLYAAIEDFGIVMGEALASGTPVIAYGDGGALDIVNDKNGLTYSEQTAKSLKNGVLEFEKKTYKADDCIKSVERFSKDNFKKNFRKTIEECLTKKP